MKKNRVLVIGGGFFGMYLAEYLARKNCDVVLCEKEKDFMQRASLVNQARVHNGYHYPRSIITGLRSRVSFPRFNEEFKACIQDEFEKYYFISGVLGKVTAVQFRKFCERIGAPCVSAPEQIMRLTNSSLIEGGFSVVEHAFDAVTLKELMLDRINDAGVSVRLGNSVGSVRKVDESLEVTFDAPGKFYERYDQVFNCTYSLINTILSQSGLDIIPLKHELTEMCLVEPPEILKEKGITVMCGPFFSVMPYPSKRLHSFSHVRYTPHQEWYDDQNGKILAGHKYLKETEKRSAWRSMVLDAQRYIPVLAESQYKKSIWEVKTVLPRSESNDSRPILFKANYGLKGFHCIMGGKIDNVYDAIESIERLGIVS